MSPVQNTPLFNSVSPVTDSMFVKSNVLQTTSCLSNQMSHVVDCIRFVKSNVTCYRPSCICLIKCCLPQTHHVCQTKCHLLQTTSCLSNQISPLTERSVFVQSHVACYKPHPFCQTKCHLLQTMSCLSNQMTPVTNHAMFVTPNVICYRPPHVCPITSHLLQTTSFFLICCVIDHITFVHIHLLQIKSC